MATARGCNIWQLEVIPRLDDDVLVVSDLPRPRVQRDQPGRQRYPTNDCRSMLQHSDAVAYLGLN
jgi:hypothetical protein